MTYSSVVVPERGVPLWIRLLGGKWRNGRRAFRMSWGEVSVSRGIAVELALFEEHYSLHLHLFLVNLYIHLPWMQRWHREPFEVMEAWGLSMSVECGLHLHWGARTKVVTMPWRDWVQTAHDVRCADGSWEPFIGSWEHKGSDGRRLEIYPYRYLLRSGEVQDRTATIHVERRIRKLRWLRWLPWGATAHAISVEFSDEVGERAGSWKGGCTGCGYTLRPGETPRECIARMESERKF